MGTVFSDFRQALRVFRRAPSFAIAVVAVLALGIGANTAIFSIVNAVLLRPLPFDQPGGLVRLYHTPPQSTFPGMATFSLSPANFIDWQRDSTSFEAMAAYRFRQLTLTGSGTAEAFRATVVGPDFFRIVRTPPALGRTFVPEEHEPARAKVVVLSDGFWKTHLGAAPDAAGRTLTFDGETYTVVGVMPPDFTVAAWGATAQPMWVPLAWTDTDRAVRENHLVSRTQAIDVVGIVGDVKEELAEKAPPTVYLYSRDLPFGDLSLAIRTAGEPAALIKPAVAAVHALDSQLPVQQGRTMNEVIEETLVSERFRALLLQVFAAAALTLASVGIYSVLSYLVRGRRREIGIRTAFGAATGDVLRMVLIEGLKPTLAGIALGAVGALLAARLLEKLVFGVEASDPLTLAVVASSLLAVSVAASLLPAWRASRLDPVTVLRD